jgi:hypothetical protein
LTGRYLGDDDTPFLGSQGADVVIAGLEGAIVRVRAAINKEASEYG